MRCTCVKAGRKCLNCLPSKRNRCSNRLQCASSLVCDDASLLARDSSNVISPSSVEGERFVRAFGAPLLHSEGKPHGSFWGQLWLRIISIKNSHYNLPNGSVGRDFVGLLSGEVNLLVQGERFVRAFGAPLLHSEGKPHGSFWGQLWLRIISIKNSHYNLPNGSVGRDFVGLLSGEVNLLVQGSISSERVIVFLTVILQRDPMVKRNADVRRLLHRRMEDWKGVKN